MLIRATLLGSTLCVLGLTALSALYWTDLAWNHKLLVLTLTPAHLSVLVWSVRQAQRRTEISPSARQL